MEWLKYVLAVAVGAFIAGGSALQFIDARIEKKLEPYITKQIAEKSYAPLPLPEGLRYVVNSVEGSPIATKTIELQSEGVAIVTAFATGQGLQGNERTALHATVIVDGNICAREYNWVPTGSIEHKASATCVIELSTGSHVLAAKAEYDRIATPSTSLQYIVLYD